MLSLSATLLAAQKALNKTPLWKVVLSRTGQTTRGYSSSRIRNISRTETPAGTTAIITLDNSDGGLTSLDFEHFQAVISYGYKTGVSRTAWAANTAYSVDAIRRPTTANGYQYRCAVAGTSHAATEPTWPTDLGVRVADGTVTWEMDGNSGDEYGRKAPLRVRVQENHSGMGILRVILRCVGIKNQLAEDEAIAAYTQLDTDTNTLKTLLTAVATAGAGLSSAYNGYTAVTVTYDSEDSVIDTFAPKEFFFIKIKNTRWAKIQELLGYTKCVAKEGNDGQLHILVPTTTGTTYAYEYKLNVSGDHNFRNKTVRKSFVKPNKEIVSTASGITPSYTGNATSATSYALDPKINTTIGRYADDAQCTLIAEAKIARNELDAERGFATVPINVGQELFDYIKITDSRENDTRVGNVQYIHETVAVGEKSLNFSMEVSFGKVATESLLSDMLTAGGEGNDTRLSNQQILTLYDNIISYLEANAQQTTWVEESTPDSLDDVPDGVQYKRLDSTQVSANKISLNSLSVFAAGYDPSSKRRVFVAQPTTPYDLGDLWGDGTTLAKCTTARASGAYQAGDWTAVTQDEIANGVTWGRLYLTDIQAGHILLSKLTAKEGAWYDVSGVLIDANAGIAIYGTNMALVTGALIANISAFDNAGGGLVGVTTASVHGLTTGDYVYIAGTTNYNGYFQVTVTSTTRFTITDTWVANDATGKVLSRQCYVGSDGKLYAGAGAVLLDILGITINGQYLTLKDGANISYIYQTSTQLAINTTTLTIGDASGALIRPWDATGSVDLGSAAYPFGEVHANAGYINGADAAVIASGSYTGDDTTDRAIAHGLGRIPKLIKWSFATGANIAEQDCGANAVSYWVMNSATEGNYGPNTAADVDNFYVNGGGGDAYQLNKSTFTYYWKAIG